MLQAADFIELDNDEVNEETSQQPPSNATSKPEKKDEGVPLYVGLTCIGIIVVVVIVVAIVLKKKGDPKYDPTVDLGLVENEIL